MNRGVQFCWKIFCPRQKPSQPSAQMADLAFEWTWQMADLAFCPRQKRSPPSAQMADLAFDVDILEILSSTPYGGRPRQELEGGEHTALERLWRSCSVLAAAITSPSRLATVPPGRGAQPGLQLACGGPIRRVALAQAHARAWATKCADKKQFRCCVLSMMTLPNSW